MAEERFVTTTDGLRLFTDAEGKADGFPMLLCDGLGCAGFIWREFRRAFADRFRLLHFHFRGHGLSQAPEDPDRLAIEYLCGDIGATLDAYGVNKVILVGHSMGVQLILQYAYENPERIVGLIPICGSYGTPLRTFHDSAVAHHVLPYVQQAVDLFPRLAQRLWSGVANTEAAYQLGTRMELNHKLLRREVFAPYLEHMAGMDIQVFLNTLEHINQHSVEAHLGELSMPALVVAGEQDTFTPAWLSERMVDLLPNAELLMMPSGSHTAPIEIPELLHLRVDQFLRDKLADVLGTATPGRRKRVSKPRTKKKSTGPTSHGKAPPRSKPS